MNTLCTVLIRESHDVRFISLLLECRSMIIVSYLPGVGLSCKDPRENEAIILCHCFLSHMEGKGLNFSE